MILQVSSDSESWLRIKHALREAGLKFYLQENMYGPEKTLFVEPRAVEPEGGKLTQGFIVYQGGAEISSPIQEVYEQEIGKS
jgi:hypothetical protein